MAPGARLRTKVYGCLGRVPSADGHPKSAVVESSYEVEGVGIHGIGIARLPITACRAPRCHGEVIEGSPCAEAADRQAIHAIHVHCELRDIP